MIELCLIEAFRVCITWYEINRETNGTEYLRDECNRSEEKETKK